MEAFRPGLKSGKLACLGDGDRKNLVVRKRSTVPYNLAFNELAYTRTFEISGVKITSLFKILDGMRYLAYQF